MRSAAPSVSPGLRAGPEENCVQGSASLDVVFQSIISIVPGSSGVSRHFSKRRFQLLVVVVVKENE